MKKIYTLLVGLMLSFGAFAQCSDLFISEYAEGSSSNKYLEIYNPSSSSVDLSDYSLFMINNGGTANNIGFDLSGTLGAHEVYVLAANQADSAGILAKTDTALSYNSVCHFNGDDAVMLLKGTDTIDIIGERWVDPGSGWTVGTGNTKDFTLVRKASVSQGQTDWSVGATEWDVYPKDDWSNLGGHASNCAPATAPSTAAPTPTDADIDVVSLFSNAYTDVTVNTFLTGWSAASLEEVQIAGDDVKKYSNVNFLGIEAVGDNSIDASNMEYFSFDVWTPEATTYRIKLVDFGADNAFGGGDDTEHEIAFENPSQGTWNHHKIALSDFTNLTGTGHVSQFIFSALPVGGATLFVDNMYFSKDPSYTVSTIADAIMLDADLAPTNEDALYELTGVVYGVDLDGNAGLSFTIIDETAGINVFNFNDVSDYVVTEGDEITVRGKIDFYRGLLELLADSIRVNSTGNTLVEPTVVTMLDESTESNLISLEKVWLADTTTVWPYGNVLLTNASMDTFTMRIDNSLTDVVGTPVMYDTMNIVGIGGQFDFDAPYNEGYQIFPRTLGDITEWKDLSGVNKLNSSNVTVYPNPASNVITVSGNEAWNTYVVYNVLGNKVLEGTLNRNSISVADLAEGTYVLRVQSGAKQGVSRFVVSK